MTSPDTTQGTAPPTNDLSQLAFVHGFLDSAATWSPLIDALKIRGVASVAWDLRGAGERRDEEGPMSLMQAAEDIAQRLHSLHAPVILVGHSMGAQIAELAARRAPDTVSALVLMTPTPLQGNALPDAIRDMLRESGGNADAQRAIRRNFSHNLSDAAIEACVAPTALMGEDATRAYYDAFTTGVPDGQAASRFDGPTLVLGAADDPVIAPAMVSAIHAARFPQAQLASVDGSGHWPQLEQVDGTADLLLAFAQRVAAASAGE